MSEAQRGPEPKPFALSLWMLGIQAVWGALLGISLQERITELAPGNALIAYGPLAGTAAAVAGVTQVVAGYLSDRRRRRGSRRTEFYVVAAIGGAIAVAAFYGARDFTTLAVAYVALQAALNVGIGPYQAILPDFVVPRRLGVASSWMAGMQSVGNALGAVLAATLADFRLLAASIDALLIGTCAATVAHVRTLALREPAAEVRPNLTRAFVDLFISRALIFFGFYTLLGYLFFYVSGVLGASGTAQATRQTGVLILLFTVVGAAGAAIAAKPSDRFDKRLVATIGGGTTILALLLFVAAHSLAAAAAASAVAGLGWGIFLVADWALACRIMPPGGAGTSMGIWNLAVVGPQVAAPLFTTWFLTRLGSANAQAAPREAFVLAACETLGGICWLWRLTRQAAGKTENVPVCRAIQPSASPATARIDPTGGKS
ncbi:MAG TPA: MFS transporter [Verrucomicrobiae bacterium]|nr:MFS transporter [Verrucomicrobiae bacterium]